MTHVRCAFYRGVHVSKGFRFSKRVLIQIKHNVVEKVGYLQGEELNCLGINEK